MTADTEALLTAITRAQKDYVVGQSPRSLFDRMLSDLLSLTGSEYGFIGEILATAEGAPYLKTHAITNIAWDEATRRFYDEKAPDGMEFYNLKSLFGEVMVTERPVVSNAPATDPRRCGTPPGHPPLDAFLGAPFFHGGRFVGMVGIANRREGYDEQLIEWLQPFLTTCAGIISAHRAWRERSAIEDDLRDARDAAEAANRAKTQFLANMSHELRTPLNAVIGFSKRLLPSFSGNDQLLLDRIHKNGTQLLSIVNDLLDVSRIEVGEVTLDLTDVDLRPLVASVVEDIRGLVHGDVQIRSVLPGDGPLRLRADENRLRQILNNLMSNALKFTESGTVTVEVVTSLGGEVEHIAVSDTGIGISTSDLERVFLPFHQADNSHARPHDGTGLGLALCKSFAELMGFRMEATSNPGVGSTFRVVVR